MRKHLALSMALCGAALAAILACSQAPRAVGPESTKELDLGSGAKLRLVRIPAGTFTMGSPDTETNRVANETPHEVALSKPFYMGATLVTVDQFAAFANASGYRTDAEREGASPGLEKKDGQLDRSVMNHIPGYSWRNPSFKQAGNHPVVQISWTDATAFCDWLSKKSGKTVTLPTEAQWEYACRAGTKTAYPWGDDPNQPLANVADQSLRKLFPADPASAFSPADDGYPYTSPVGSYKPNAFGLYDMPGNVFEWCRDWYAPYPAPAAGGETVTDPEGPAAGRLHITRGGSFNNEPYVARSAFRYFATPDHRNFDYGFRVVVLKAD